MSDIIHKLFGTIFFGILLFGLGMAAAMLITKMLRYYQDLSKNEKIVNIGAIILFLLGEILILIQLNHVWR